MFNVKSDPGYGCRVGREAVVMTGAELAVGYFVAWVVRKVRRVAGSADEEVDRVLDASMERVHDLISQRIGGEPALHQLEAEIQAGQDAPRELTRRRVVLALQDAVESDTSFADELNQLLDELAQYEEASGGVSAGAGGVAAGGHIDVHAEHGSVAGVIISGGVHLGNPTQPGPGQR